MPKYKVSLEYTEVMQLSCSEPLVRTLFTEADGPCQAVEKMMMTQPQFYFYYSALSPKILVFREDTEETLEFETKMNIVYAPIIKWVRPEGR